MKTFFTIIVFLPSFLFAQYYFERSNEQNFETSNFYFSKYTFNPYGMDNFREISLGLINNPFLNIFLNPSRIIELKDRLYFYIDYRGERNLFDSEIFDYPIPLLGNPNIYPEWIYPSPEYINQARTEPEPKFSIGVAGSPISYLSNKLFVGATFQLINKSEKFYSMPYWIYYPILGYDPFGNRYAESSFYPEIYYRYTGKDEMTTTAKLFSFFAGYKINDNFSAGFQISGIDHSREGGYRNNYNDDYGNIDNTISQIDYLIEKTNKYNQIDYSVGLNYTKNSTSLGASFGFLNGNAAQTLKNINKFFYQLNNPDVSSNWSQNLNDYNSTQNWNNTGKLYHLGFDILHKINSDLQFVSYFNYLGGNIDFTNSSNILDTNFYYSKYDYYSGNQNYFDISKYSYSILDTRTGSGLKKKSNYAGLIGLRWIISPKINVTLGLAYYENNLKITSNEPVIFESINKHYFTSSKPDYSNNTRYLRIYEDKILQWHYNFVNFSYQIPVFFDFKLNEKIELNLLINQISGGSKITEYTDASIKLRIRTEDDSTKQLNNFIERYSKPATNITFDETDLIMNFKFYLHPNLNFNFLIDPELNPIIISQWWFSIEGKF